MDEIMELINRGLEMNRRLNKQVFAMSIHYYPERGEHLVAFHIGDDCMIISMERPEDYKIKALSDALEAQDDNT